MQKKFNLFFGPYSLYSIDFEHALKNKEKKNENQKNLAEKISAWTFAEIFGF